MSNLSSIHEKETGPSTSLAVSPSNPTVRMFAFQDSWGAVARRARPSADSRQRCVLSPLDRSRQRSPGLY
jgi:hypothetical protein